MTWGFTQQPPDSTGKKIRTRIETAGGADYHVQAVTLRGLPTFFGLSNGYALQTANAQAAIHNYSGSGLIVEVHALQATNISTAAHAGITARALLVKTGAPPGGTALPLSPNDGTVAAPAASAVGWFDTCSSLPVGGNVGWFSLVTDDPRSAAGISPNSARGQNLMPITGGGRPLVLAAGEGLIVQYFDADATAAIVHRWLVGIAPA